MCGHMGATAARNNWWLLVELNTNGVRWLFDPPSWGGAVEQPCADDPGNGTPLRRPPREAARPGAPHFLSDPLALSGRLSRA